VGAGAGANRLGLARGDENGRKWPLNEGRIPNPNVRVAPGTGYHRVEGNRRASRNGRVSDLPPETRLVFTIRTFIAPHPKPGAGDHPLASCDSHRPSGSTVRSWGPRRAACPSPFAHDNCQESWVTSYRFLGDCPLRRAQAQTRADTAEAVAAAAVAKVGNSKQSCWLVFSQP
jgi:hypothetical protein